jgi:hypothetical protein
MSEGFVIMACSITGRIYDANKNGVPNANVIMWHFNENGELIQPVQMPENPMLSNDGRTKNVGDYSFINVNPGKYAITVEKNMLLGRCDVEVGQEDITGLDIVMDKKSAAKPSSPIITSPKEKIPQMPKTWSGDIPQMPKTWSGDIPQMPKTWNGKYPKM